ncbi:MAG: redoxin domain-containing protein [Clostridia bacterium]|nr:redoxin domain-containing protein [Clostridia bacterium]
MKKTLAALLVLALCLLLAASAEETSAESFLGRPMPDFTVTTLEGGTFTLSEALRTKRAVLINLWATWCGPCEYEFPYLEQAYEAYADQVAVIALSVEPGDTPEVLKEYAESHGLTFDIGSDTGVGLADLFMVRGIPTTVLVDRFGNVALVEVGSQTSEKPFMNAFGKLTADGYSETEVMDGFPSSLPDVDAGPEGYLSEYLGVPFAITGSEDAYVWPFVAGDLEGKACAKAGNAGNDGSAAEMNVLVTAGEGDALTFSVRTSSEAMYDIACVLVNGKSVKQFSGEDEAWISWAVALEPGENVVTFRYEKDEMESVGEDTAYVADLALVSGDEARAALEALPVYPYAEETGLRLVTEGAREIVFAPGESGTIADAFGEDCTCWIVFGNEVEFTASITSDYSEDDVVVYSNCELGQDTWTAWDFAGGPLVSAVDSLSTSGYSYTNVIMVQNSRDEVLDMHVLFSDEENANAFEAMLNEDGFTAGYTYADGSERSTYDEAEDPAGQYEGEEWYAEDPEEGDLEEADDELIDAAFGEADEELAASELVWTVTFLDQNGDPVPGCVVNFCTEETCTPCVSDETGVAFFSGEPYPYHLQVIKVPDGYAFEPADDDLYADENGGDMEILVEKLEA